MIRARAKRRLSGLNIRSQAQEKVYVPNNTYYCYADALPTVSFPNSDFGVSINILLTAKATTKNVFACGTSFSNSDFNLTILSTGRPKLLVRDSTNSNIPLTSNHVLPNTDDGDLAWVTVSFGWDSAAGVIWLKVGDNLREEASCTSFGAGLNDRRQRFIFGGAAAGNLDTNFEFYDINVVLDGGMVQVQYLCEDDAGGVCAASDSRFDAQVLNAASEQGPGIAVTPTLATPEPEPPEPPVEGENRFTATSTDATATYVWECKPDSIPDDLWYPALTTLTGASVSGANNEFLDINSADYSDQGKISPLAVVAAYPNGKRADVVADLIVIDPGQPQPEPDTEAPVIVFTDMLAGKKSGWNVDGDAELGAVITVWGHRLGTPSTRGSDYVKVGNDTVGWTVLDDPKYYPEAWSEFDKPIPWLQSIAFHLTTNMTDGDMFVVVNVNGKDSNPLPIHVHDEGRIIHVDWDVAGPGTGTHDDPHPDLEDYYRAWQAGDTFYIRGTGVRGIPLTRPDEPGARAFIECDGVASPAPTQNRPLCIVGYPGSYPQMTHHVADGQPMDNLDKGVVAKHPYFTMSKMNFSVDNNAGKFISQGAYGGWNRIVGIGSEGCHRHESGTGIYAMTSGGEKGSPDNQDSGHKWLGCTVYGGKTCHGRDHAIYIAANPKDEGCEVGYCYIHSCDFGKGSLVSSNHQVERVGEGQFVRQHWIHHNYIDARTTRQFPPVHDPDWNSNPVPNASKYHDAALQVAIGFGPSGVTNGRLTAEPHVFHNNVVLGTNEALPSPEASPAGLVEIKSSGGGYVLNNLFIDWGEQAVSDPSYEDGDPNKRPYLFQNNTFWMRTTPVLAGDYYPNKEGSMDGNSAYNNFWGGNNPFGQSQRDHEPDIDVDSFPNSFTANDSGLVDQGLLYQDINTTYDFNGILYVNVTPDPGAFEYVSPPAAQEEE